MSDKNRIINGEDYLQLSLQEAEIQITARDKRIAYLEAILASRHLPFDDKCSCAECLPWLTRIRELEAQVKKLLEALKVKIREI